jgi:hypothetical protein
MKYVRIAEAALWMLALAGVAAAALALTSPLAGAAAAPAPAEAPGGVARAAYDAAAVARAVVERDVFRLERRPAAVRYDPERQSPEAVPAYAPPRPALVLRGIVWGDTARALIEGFPGTEGARLVRAGDVVGELRVAAIARRSARILAPDTTWVLHLGRSGP